MLWSPAAPAGRVWIQIAQCDSESEEQLSVIFSAQCIVSADVIQ